jgi:glutathionylspermidine synthase
VGEDVMTTTYLRQTADDAGVDTASIRMCDIGYLPGQGFVDLDDESINSIFKLYPWEWLLSEQFAPELLEQYTSMMWLEPIWKLILSSKGLLPILWELNPGHPNLLEAHFEKPRSLTEYARKPLFSREGGNIKLFGRGVDSESSGTYGKEGYVYQKLHLLPSFLGNRPVLGSWIVDGQPCGIGIRESTKLITDQEATFVPHVVE